MKLLGLLIVLAVRHLDIEWPRWLRERDRFAALMDPFADLGGATVSGGLAWSLRVLLPALLVALALALIDGIFWGVLGGVAGVLLVLWLLGAESEHQCVDELLVHGRMNDTDGLSRVAAKHFGVEGPADNAGWFQTLRTRVLERQAHHLFATSFWLIALGYWAAALYALNYWWLRHASEDDTALDMAKVMHTAFFWIPGRLLILCLGLAGDWHRVREAIGDRLWDLGDTEPLLRDALLAALDRGEDAPGRLQGMMDALEAQQGLMLRCLALWLLLAALWVLLVN